MDFSRHSGAKSSALIVVGLGLLSGVLGQNGVPAGDALRAYDYSNIGKSVQPELVINGKRLHNAYYRLTMPYSVLVISDEGATEVAYANLSDPMRVVCALLQAEAGAGAYGSLGDQIARAGGRRLVGKVVSIVDEGVLVDATEFALSSHDSAPPLDVCWLARGLLPPGSCSPISAAYYLVTDYARAKNVAKDDVIGLVVYPRNETYSYVSLLGKQTVHIVSPFPPAR